MNNINIDIDAECINEKFRPLLDGRNLKYYNVCYGGPGSSKTYSILQIFIIRALKFSNKRYLVLRKTRQGMDSTIVKDIKNILRNFKLDDFVIHNQTKGTFTFPNNSIISYHGYDDPEKYKGLTADMILLDEYTNFSIYADGTTDLQHIVDRLRGIKNPRIFITFNPVDINHFVRHELFSSEDPHKPINDNILLNRSTYRDNPFYGKKALEQFLKQYENNPRRAKMALDGDWATLGELIYENYEIYEEEHPDSYYDVISYGCDFGFAHNTAFVKTAIKDKNIYILKEIYAPKLTALKLVDLIKRNFDKKEYLNMKIICDSARPEMIEEMNNNGLYSVACKKGAGSVLDGIEWIQDRKLHIYKDCIGTIKEAESYQWQTDKRTGIKLPNPIKTNDDCLDAIRYSCEDFKNNSIITFA